MAKKKDTQSDTLTDSGKEHALEEFGPDEPTPANSQIIMSESMYVMIKVIAAHRQMLMRDFYAQAFAEFVEKRRNWDEEKDGEFIYRATPKEGKSVNIAVFESHFEDIDRIADEDNMRRRTAYYNAIHDHVRKLSKGISL